MKRRNFLKGIFGAYALSSGYFSFKYFNNKNTSSSTEKFIERIEIPIVYHCNLNCAYCDHFAPIAPEYMMPVETFKKDMIQLKKITKGNIKEITILGGEPLLHSNLNEILRISREYFPDTRIEMLTNGTLLEQQSDDFWQTCTKENIGVYISYYKTGKKLFNFDKLDEKMDKFKTKVRISYPKVQFQIMNLTQKKEHNAQERYRNCYSKLWPILDDGKFYACSTINGVEKFFNKKFPKNTIPIEKNDVLDIYKISSIDELIEFYEKSKSVCSHCNYYISGKKDWALSKKELGEWYKA